MIEFVNEHLKIREKFVNKTFELKKTFCIQIKTHLKKIKKKRKNRNDQQRKRDDRAIDNKIEKKNQSFDIKINNN